MLKLLIFLSLVVLSFADSNYYHTFNGTILSEEEYQAYVNDGVAGFCAINVKDCDANEYRRIDGTCNNLKHKIRGGPRTPYTRVLPANFYDVDQHRRAKSGGELPNGRKIRTSILYEGRVPDTRFTNMIPIFWTFLVADATLVEDTLNYMFPPVPCCFEVGKVYGRCQQLEVPVDDPVGRFSGLRCLNYTTPISYQNTGCLRNKTTPEGINGATPLIDLSSPYLNILANLTRFRKYSGGLINYDELKNAYSLDPSVVASSLFMDLAWQQHNRLANELSSQNPCWDDDKLFYTAKDLNIIIFTQIFLYEMLPTIIDKSKLIEDGILSATKGFRDVYDENILPQQSIEYLYALRWVHTLQEGSLKFYDYNGNFVKTYPVVNASVATGHFLMVDRNKEYVMNSVVRQPCSKIGDQFIDPDLAQIALEGILDREDIFSLDNIKGRYFGLQPYVKYLEHWSGKSYKTFEDLADVVAPEKIGVLKNVYEHVEDIELLAGMWVENLMNNSYVPQTFYYFLADQLKRNIASDRYWYERSDRPQALTEAQLSEMRKITMSRILCTVGNFTVVQPRAFELPGIGNQIDLCAVTTEDIDMSVFADPSCSS